MSASRLRSSGLILGYIPWGTHICHFYRNKSELLEILVPYLRAGLENGEFCIWLPTGSREEAREELKKSIKGFEDYLNKGQIEIIPYREWCSNNHHQTMHKWRTELDNAMDRGYAGLRVAGDTDWLEQDGLNWFLEYEEEVNQSIDDYRMIALCSYPLHKHGTYEVIEVSSKHHYTLFKESEWRVIENSEHKKAVNILHARNEKYRTLVENANEGIVVIQDGLISFINPKVLEISGYSQKELMLNSFTQFIHSDDMDRVYEKHIKRLRGEEFSSRYSFRFITRDGGIRWVEVNAVLIEWEGKPATLNFLTDITERKEAEDRLRETNLLLETLLNAIPDVVYVKDTNGRNLLVNRAFEEMTGLSKDEVVGKTDDQLLPPELAEKCWASDREVLEKSEVVGIEEDMPGNGKRFYYDTIKAPLLHDGSVRGIVGISRDITERKEAELALKESEQRYRATFENTGTAMMVIEEDTTLSQVNKEFENLSGYKREEVEGKMSWTDFVHPDDVGRMKDYHYARRRGEDVPMKYEFRFINMDGEIRNVLIAVDVIAGTGKSVASIMDITHFKKLNKLLKVLSEINELVAKERSPRVVLKAVCEKLYSLYDAVFTSLISDNDLVPVESKGIDAASMRRAVERCPSIAVAMRGEIKKIRMKDVAEKKCPTINHNYVLSIPLKHHEQKGVITIYSDKDFDEEELFLLEKLSSNIAFALSAYETERDRELAMEQLAQNLTQFDKSADRLRNPLAIIMSSLELKNEYENEELLEIVGEQAKRIKEELDNLRLEENKTFELTKKVGNRD